MKIHSSSLAHIPAGYNANKKKGQIKPTENNQERRNPPTVISSPTISRVDKKNDAPKLELITKKIDQQQKLPATNQSARAVNAYIEENEQPYKSQRAELVSGIDLFA